MNKKMVAPWNPLLDAVECGYVPLNELAGRGNAWFVQGGSIFENVVGHQQNKSGVTVVLRSLLLSAFALAMTGCASVKVSLPLVDAPKTVQSEEVLTQRVELMAAVDRLEQRPWSEADANEADLVTFIFGGSGPSPRQQAITYINTLDDASEPMDVVRADVERTLSAAWQVADTGRETTSSMDPVAEDLRLLEAAIMQARQCRLVYAETMSLLAKRDGSADRDDIRKVKRRFNEAILELGRTADALSVQLADGPSQNFAGNQSAF